jgi:hypothetical protein
MRIVQLSCCPGHLLAPACCSHRRRPCPWVGGRPSMGEDDDKWPREPPLVQTCLHDFAQLKELSELAFRARKSHLGIHILRPHTPSLCPSPHALLPPLEHMHQADGSPSQEDVVECSLTTAHHCDCEHNHRLPRHNPQHVRLMADKLSYHAVFLLTTLTRVD